MNQPLSFVCFCWVLVVKSSMSAAPSINLSAIPAAQRATVMALLDEVASLKEITRRQVHLIAELNHALHGKRSEKLS